MEMKGNKGLHVKVLSLAVIVMMMFTPLLAIEGGVDASSDSPAAVYFEDNGNGTYTLKQEYLESVFKVDGKPSEVEDPIGNVVIEPKEIVFNTDYIFEHSPDGVTTVNSSDQYLPEKLDNRHVSFSAAMIDGQVDQICMLELWSGEEDSNSTRDAELTLYVNGIDGENIGSVKVTDYINPAYMYSLEDVRKVPGFQASNVINYAVGDLDGDGLEEIATVYNTRLLFVDYNIETKAFDVYNSSLPISGDYDNTILSPVDILVAEMDGDEENGMEVAVARSYYTFYPGNGEETWLSVFKFDKDVSSYENRHVLEIYDPNDKWYLDTLMVSLASADVDNDGEQELVVGGYLWDYRYRETSYTQDWPNWAGELFLFYDEFENVYGGKLEFKGLTILGDDNGTASTRYNPSNDDFEDDYELYNHNSHDTSIYTTDESDDGIGLSRSPNWSNWTIPLMGGSLTGPVNGKTYDQVFFDVGVYEYNGTGFVPFADTPKLNRLMDNNNVMCYSMDFGTILNQDPNEFTGKGEFFISYGVDLHKSVDGGRVEYYYAIYGYDTSGSQKIDVYYSSDEGYSIQMDWDEDNCVMSYIGNFDNDSYSVEYVSHVFTYTDPKVIAAISAVPYDADLASLLMLGSDNIGSTSYSKGTGTEETSSFDLGFNAHGMFEGHQAWGWLESRIEAGYQLDHSWIESDTVVISETYTSSHNSVAMYVTPVDLYFYNVYCPNENGDGYDIIIQAIPMYCKTVTTILNESEYQRFIDDYNKVMGDYMGKDFIPIQKIQFSDTVEGDLSSYRNVPSDPLVDPVQIYYDQGGLYSTVTDTVEMNKAEGDSHSNGFYFNFDLMVGKWKNHFGGGVGMDFNWTSSDMDLSNMSFSVMLAQGNENNYLGYPSEAADVLSQYSMTGTMWAEKRPNGTYVSGDNSVEETYVYIGFTVDDYTLAPKLGSLIPNTYIPDGTDEEDPFNPTSDSICLDVIIPSKDRYLNAGDEYIVQMEYQGCWIDVGKVSGLSIEEFVGNAWVPSEGVFQPMEGESKHIVRVNGLSSLAYYMFDFRLMTVLHDGHRDLINPTIAVTGYKDARTVNADVALVSVHEPQVSGYLNSVTISKDSLAGLSDGTFVIVQVDADIGSRMDIVVSDDGRVVDEIRNLLVYNGGYLIFQHDAGPDPGTEPWMTVAVVSAILIVCLGALAVRRG